MPGVQSGASSVLLGLPAIEMLVEKGVGGVQRRMKIMLFKILIFMLILS